MKILLIILSVIGSLKLVSLFVLCVLQIYSKIKGNKVLESHRDACFYINDRFYIFPSIEVSKSGKYFKIAFYWFNIQYYEATKLEYEKDEE